MRMTLGMHEGKLIEDFPAAHLDRVLRECRTSRPWLLEEIREHLEAMTALNDGRDRPGKTPSL